MYSATAKIAYLDIYEKQCEENIILTGIPSFTEAMRQIEDYYGEDLIQVLELTLYDLPFIYKVPDEEIERIAKLI